MNFLCRGKILLEFDGFGVNVMLCILPKLAYAIFPFLATAVCHSIISVVSPCKRKTGGMF
jgi:hypothetical protein